MYCNLHIRIIITITTSNDILIYIQEQVHRLSQMQHQHAGKQLQKATSLSSLSRIVS